jgi:membrane protein
MSLASREAAKNGLLYLGVLRRALLRLWGRDVMLYVGGVSFFALLAVFPALTILLGLYGAVFTPAEAQAQAAGMAHLLPEGAQSLFLSEMARLSTAPVRTVSAQSALALTIGAYAAHRGFKALLAGLTFIHDEEEPLGFFRFNFLAFIVALAAFALATVISGAVIVARVLESMSSINPPDSFGPFQAEWIWAALGLSFGLSCMYRYAMSHSGPVIWRAAIIGGVTAGIMALVASWASAFYVDQIVRLGATYGSLATVIIFLIWLSWNVNAVFFGGALATEVEIALNEYRAQRRKDADEALSLSSPRRAFRQ